MTIMMMVIKEKKDKAKPSKQNQIKVQVMKKGVDTVQMTTQVFSERGTDNDKSKYRKGKLRKYQR